VEKAGVFGPAFQRQIVADQPDNFYASRAVPMIRRHRHWQCWG